MTTSTSIRLIAVTAVVFALAAPAAAGDVVLRRDSSKAVPFAVEPPATSTSDVTLRRDPAQAVPAAADLESGRPVAGDDGFHWDDAALGMAAGSIAVIAALGAVALLRSRRPRTA